MADYYNDFQRIVRSDNIGWIIDKFRLKRGKSLLSKQDEAERGAVLSVIDELKKAPRCAYEGLIKLAKICGRLDVGQFKLFCHLLRGGTFSTFAIGEGVTPAAVGQRWKTVLKRVPELLYLKGKRQWKQNTHPKA